MSYSLSHRAKKKKLARDLLAAKTPERKRKKAEQAAANAATSEAGVVGVSTSAVIPSVPVLDTSGATDVPPPTADGFYRPTPLCETEEIIGEVLGGTINTIMSGFDSAIGPVIDEVQNSEHHLLRHYIKRYH